MSTLLVFRTSKEEVILVRLSKQLTNLFEISLCLPVRKFPKSFLLQKMNFSNLFQIRSQKFEVKRKRDEKLGLKVMVRIMPPKTRGWVFYQLT